jgi:hypothetical protein
MSMAIKAFAIATVIAASVSVAFAQTRPASPARPQYPAAPNSHASHRSQYDIYPARPGRAQCIHRPAPGAAGLACQ